MIKHAIKTTALAVALAGATAAHAVPWTLTYAGGSTPVFDGFDWGSNGTVVTSTFNPTSTLAQSFSAIFFSKASAVVDQSGNPITGGTLATNPNVGISSGLFEYTIVELLNISTTCVAVSGPTCSAQLLSADPGGIFNVYYDTSPDANQATGLGFLDGDVLLSGTVATGVFGFYSAMANLMAFSVLADTTFVDGSYISPITLDQSINTGSAQFNSTLTGWVPASSLPSGSLLASSRQFQADANQYFLAERRVPEPGSLALLGTTLGGLGWFSRRRPRKES